MIKPTKQEVHPATAVMLSYLNNKVGMKKLDEWKRFFDKKIENKLANSLYEAARKIIEGEEVEEVDFIALMWMILRFDKDEEVRKERIEIEKDKRRLRK